MILTKEQKRDKSHWLKVIKNLKKKAEKRGFSLDSERQERYLAEFKINQLYEPHTPIDNTNIL